MAGPEPLPLLDHAHVSARDGADPVGLGADYENNPVGEGAGQLQWIPDERPAAELMENLGLPGAHALALPGGENDDRQPVHATPFILRRVRKLCAISSLRWILAG